MRESCRTRVEMLNSGQATPLSIAIALFLTEIAPRRVERDGALPGVLHEIVLALAEARRLPRPDRAVALEIADDEVPVGVVQRLPVARLEARVEAQEDDLIVLDVRERDAYENGHIPGARLLPRGQLELRVNPRGIQGDAVFEDATFTEDFSPDYFYDTAARITFWSRSLAMRMAKSVLHWEMIVGSSSAGRCVTRPRNTPYLRPSLAMRSVA